MLTVAQRRKQRREVLPLAVLVQMTANINRNTEQRFQPFELEEVLGWLGFPPEAEAPPPEPPRPTTEELREKLAMLQNIFPAHNGQGPES